MNNLAVKPYVLSGIEWTLDKEFHYGIENAKYLETLINDTKLLPIKNGEIKFEDNKWDFRPYHIMKKTSNMVFNFNSIPNDFIVNAKFFVLLSLLNSNKKVSSLNRRFQDLKPFLIYLGMQNIKSLGSVFPSTIDCYLNTKEECSAQTKIMVYNALIEFYKFLKANYSYKLYFNMKDIIKKKEEYQSIAKKTLENNKTPNIPKYFYNLLISFLIKAMRNKNLSYNKRAIACIYVILSQTGLRINEILSLEVGSLKSIKLKNLETIGYFLNYKDFKSAGKEQEFILAEIFANELTKEAFETLLELRKFRPNKEDNNFIYIPNTKELPATDSLSNHHFCNLLYKYADFAKGTESPYPELSVVKNNGKSVIAPTTKQFRVHVCTELYERDVPLLYIKKYMSHLSDEMTGYYVRPKNKKQENIEYSNKLLKELVTNEASLLGNDAINVKANIDKFICDSKLNVEDDLDAIINTLNDKFVIRAKRGGVCVKTSIRECAKDARTNEMFCAYNICPNLFHLYYMVDISYDDYKLTQKTFEYNKDNGFKVQASKELNKLHDLCKRRLIPELEDLKQKIQLKGIESILKNYPYLGDIVINYGKIMEEIELWMKKKF